MSKVAEYKEGPVKAIVTEELKSLANDLERRISFPLVTKHSVMVILEELMRERDIQPKWHKL